MQVLGFEECALDVEIRQVHATQAEDNILLVEEFLDHLCHTEIYGGRLRLSIPCRLTSTGPSPKGPEVLRDKMRETSAVCHLGWLASMDNISVPEPARVLCLGFASQIKSRLARNLASGSSK